MKKTIIIYAVILAIAIGISMAFNLTLGPSSNYTDPTGGDFLLVAMTLWLVALTVTLIVWYRRQLKTNRLCSYTTVALLGMIILVFFTALVFVTLSVLAFFTGDHLYPSQFATLFSQLTLFFAIMDIPIIGGITFFLFLSNILLLRKEGIRPTNMLGFFVNLVAVAGYFIIMFIDIPTDDEVIRALCSGAQTAFAYIMSYFECMFLSLIICGAMASRHKPAFDKDFVIILGCGIRPDGTPTPLLQSRIDRALDFVRKQEEATGKPATFVCSGGQGSDEVISEAQCMANYLMSQGIPAQRILLEEKSTSTQENMRFSQQLIDETMPNAKVAFSTTNYHVFRGGMFALELGMNAECMGSHTKWYFWPNAAIREMVGFFAANNKLTVLMIICMALFGLAVGILDELPLYVSTYYS